MWVSASGDAEDAHTPLGADTPRGRPPWTPDTPLFEQTIFSSRHPPGQIPRSRNPCQQTSPRSRHPPGPDTPPSRHTPREQTPPWKQTPLPRKADSGIRSTSGRYASYWNAFLSKMLSQNFIPKYFILPLFSEGTAMKRVSTYLRRPWPNWQRRSE